MSESSQVPVRIINKDVLTDHYKRMLQAFDIRIKKICNARKIQWQNFGLSLGLKDLSLASASASKLWPRPQTFVLGLASISLSYYVIGHFSGKNRVKFGNKVVNHLIIWYFFSAILNFFHNYFWPQPWPQPPEIALSLFALASASASRFWPRLTSLGRITDNRTWRIHDAHHRPTQPDNMSLSTPCRVS